MESKNEKRNELRPKKKERNGAASQSKQTKREIEAQFNKENPSVRVGGGVGRLGREKNQSTKPSVRRDRTIGGDGGGGGGDEEEEEEEEEEKKRKPIGASEVTPFIHLHLDGASGRDSETERNRERETERERERGKKKVHFV